MNLGYSPAYDTKGGKAVPWPIDDSSLCLVLHSTEADGLPTYRGGATNPHFTLDPWRRTKYQHVPCNVAARALAGSDRDTHRHAIQVEIVGWCSWADARKAGKEKTRLLDVMSAAQMTWLGKTLGEISRANGIPVRSSVTFKAYNSGIAPSSYGKANGVRLDKARYLAYEGWLGHQHVPFNSHGDPGNLNVKALLKFAEEPAKKPTSKPKGYPTPTRPLALGSKGEDVKWLQDNLRKRYAYAKKLVVDGSYGPAVRAAVREWQGRKGLDVDGAFGPASLKAARAEWKL